MVPPNCFDGKCAGVTIKSAAITLDYRCKAGAKQIYVCALWYVGKAPHPLLAELASVRPRAMIAEPAPMAQYNWSGNIDRLLTWSDQSGQLWLGSPTCWPACRIIKPRDSRTRALELAISQRSLRPVSAVNRTPRAAIVQRLLFGEAAAIKLNQQSHSIELLNGRLRSGKRTASPSSVF